jgi:multiple sugar transport system ATP-binding protein
MAGVTLRGVRKLFGALEVIKGIDLDIADRELVVFVGPSGCGKSTLLRMIAGLEDVDYGDILIDGRDVTELAPARRGVAMVFQNYALYPHMTARDNLAYGLRRAGKSRAETDQRVLAAARMLQIEELLDRLPRAMSGGQRQRVAIGRAIVREPSVFLFDEPLSNLDASLRVEMRGQIARLHRDLAATMIFVTHDQVEAMTLATRIVVMRAGRIEQTGTPREIYHNPANTFVAGFMGSPPMNLIPATAGEGDTLYLPGGGILAAPARLRTGTPVTFGIRPEHLSPADDGPITGTVSLVEHLGDETIVHLEGPGQTALALKGPGDWVLALGDRLSLSPDISRARLFDDTGQRLPSG